MISKSITEGFKFALSVKRIIPYIIIDLIVFYLLISLFTNVINLLRFEGFRTIGFLLSLGLFIPAFIIVALAQIWINGAMVDQARYFPREKSLTKSFSYSASRYLSMIRALIIFAIVNWIISLPKIIGALLVFAFSLVAYYLYPSIIVGKKSCVNAFKDTYKVFRRYPLETFLTWLLQSIISLIIMGLFALPLIFLFVGNIIGAFITMIPTAGMDVTPLNLIQSIMPGIRASISSPYFVPYLFVLVVGLAFTKLFNLGVQTRLYLNARKLEL